MKAVVLWLHNHSRIPALQGEQTIYKHSNSFYHQGPPKFSNKIHWLVPAKEVDDLVETDSSKRSTTGIGGIG